MKAALQQPEYIPMFSDDLSAFGWDEIDILLISGDACIDHPSFGTSLLARWLISHGYRVGIVAQPEWNSSEDILRLGHPRLMVGISGGALDSMLAHYTAFRKKRHDDAYSPGGRAGLRPNRAVITYTGLVRNAFPGVPVVIGGIEASLRRASHYDFWTSKLRRSILLDSKADLLVYGMAEKAVLSIARRIDDGRPLTGIPGTVYVGNLNETQKLPSHEEILEEPARLIQTTRQLERQLLQKGGWLSQTAGDRQIIFAPPQPELQPEEMDEIYQLPFSRSPHPFYREQIPALNTIRFSMTSHRGCAGGCSFCALALHQGRVIQSRSGDSLLAELSRMTEHVQWRGSVSDVGGPSANMWQAVCAADSVACERSSCLYPVICPHFKSDQSSIASLLSRMQHQQEVNHIRVASGIRHDLALQDQPYLQQLVSHHVGGQLKVAPEHCSSTVLNGMRKPDFHLFEKFVTLFQDLSNDVGKKQYVVPYLMSCFPGCTDDDMEELAAWLSARGWRPQQVQAFIPTPGTMATAMFYAEMSEDGKPIHVARSDAERRRQHNILSKLIKRD